MFISNNYTILFDNTMTDTSILLIQLFSKLFELFRKLFYNNTLLKPFCLISNDISTESIRHVIFWFGRMCDVTYTKVTAWRNTINISLSLAKIGIIK